MQVKYVAAFTPNGWAIISCGVACYERSSVLVVHVFLVLAVVGGSGRAGGCACAPARVCMCVHLGALAWIFTLGTIAIKRHAANSTRIVVCGPLPRSNGVPSATRFNTKRNLGILTFLL